MGFSETYRHEVLQSRRDRSRRALFWSRILGIVLMLTIAAILRAEPDLRRALTTAGSDAILAMMGRDAASTPQATPVVLPQGAENNAVQVSTRPRDRVRVNRPTAGATGPALDPAAMANETGAQLQTLKPRP